MNQDDLINEKGSSLFVNCNNKEDIKNNNDYCNPNKSLIRRAIEVGKFFISEVKKKKDFPN